MKFKKYLNLYSIVVCGITFALVLIPLLACVINSFRSTSDLLRGFFALPKEITLDNFIYIIQEKHVFRYLLNSLLITCGGVFISFLFNPFIAFMIATNWDKKIYRFLYIFLSACMFIPSNLILFPLIKMYYRLNLMNVWGLLLYYAAIFIPETVFMLAPYFRTFNKDIGEAARLDGCTHMQMYSKVFLPMCKPFVTTTMILNAIWLWNDFLMPLMILNKDPEMWTLPIFIYNFLGRNSFKKNYAFASCLLALIPIMLFYGIFHKKIMLGLNMKNKETR